MITKNQFLIRERSNITRSSSGDHTKDKGAGRSPNDHKGEGHQKYFHVTDFPFPTKFRKFSNTRSLP